MLQLKKSTLILCTLYILFKIFLSATHEPQSADFFQILVKTGLFRRLLYCQARYSKGKETKLFTLVKS